MQPVGPLSLPSFSRQARPADFGMRAEAPGIWRARHPPQSKHPFRTSACPGTRNAVSLWAARPGASFGAEPSSSLVERRLRERCPSGFGIKTACTTTGSAYCCPASREASSRWPVRAWSISAHFPSCSAKPSMISSASGSALSGSVRTDPFATTSTSYSGRRGGKFKRSNPIGRTLISGRRSP